MIAPDRTGHRVLVSSCGSPRTFPSYVLGLQNRACGLVQKSVQPPGVLHRHELPIADRTIVGGRLVTFVSQSLAIHNDPLAGQTVLFGTRTMLLGFACRRPKVIDAVLLGMRDVPSPKNKPRHGQMKRRGRATDAREDTMADSKPGAVLFVTSGQCGGCGYGYGADEDVSITLTKAESGKRDWKVGGSGRFGMRECPNCGAAIQIIEHQIPVYARDFNCPKCHEPGQLEVRVQKLKTARNDFEFEAILECKPCNAKSKVRQVIEKVLSIVSIEVGVGGVKVKGAGKGAGE
jgi:predicted Zn finger-like uncharacterized protein